MVPFAHRPGHYARAATAETAALARAGAEVALVTFDGVLNSPASQDVRLFSVLGSLPFAAPYRMLWRFLNTSIFPRLFLTFFESFCTLVLSLWLNRRKGFDVIHLRDGDPFLFLPHLLTCLVNGSRWLVVLIAARADKPIKLSPSIVIKRRDFLAVLHDKLVLNLGLWRPIYRRSLRRNRFLFLCQTKEVQAAFARHQGGVWSTRLVHLPLATPPLKAMPKAEAREHLKLPRDKTILLSFGANHTGKNLEVVFQALQSFPELLLVHAGMVIPDSARDPRLLGRKYGLSERTVVRDYYIPDEDKPRYFSAADAIILSYNKDFISSSSLLQEASSAGIHILASDNGEMGRLVKELRLGLVFSAEDPVSLRKAISRLLELTPDVLEDTRRNCRRFCEERTISRWADNVLGIYHYLIEMPGGADLLRDSALGGRVTKA